MFRIRDEHLAGLAPQQEENFTLRMVAHLREMFPEAVHKFDDSDLACVVRKGSEMAKSWGIDQEPQVERFLELLMSFPALRRNSLPRWIEDTVTYPGRTGKHKLRRLEDGLLFGDRE